MIIRFNENLEVEEIDAEESINAGNNLVNEIKVFMPSNFDFNSHKGYANFRLSDGKEYNNLVMERVKKENIQLEQEMCYYYVLPKFLTKQKGTIELSVRISPISNTNIIANTGVIKSEIHYAVFENGDEVLDPDTAEELRKDISESESALKLYVQETIEDGYDLRVIGTVDSINDLPKNLTYKDAGISYYVGITYPRDVYTWGYLNDMELGWSNQGPLKVLSDDPVLQFAEKQYQGSLNLFKADLLNGIRGIIVSNNGQTITMPVITSGNGGLNTQIKLRELCPNLKVGQVYFISFQRSYYDDNDYIYLDGVNKFWYNNSSKTITESELNSVVHVYANRYSSGFTEQIIITDFMINKGTKALPYHPYNAKRHITNPQADLLKSEWEKQLNLLNVPDKNSTTVNGITYSIVNGVITINGTSTSTTYINLPKNMFKIGQYHLSGLSQNFSEKIVIYLNFGDMSTYVYKEDGKTFVINTEKQPTEFYVKVSNGYTCNNVIVKPMLINGIKKQPFQEWNGKIIHEKDITPVLLWENGSPNTEFAGQTINLSESMSNYEYIIIAYKQIGAVDSEPVLHKIKNLKSYGANYSTTLSYCAGTTNQSIRTRALTFPTATTITINDAYLGNSVYKNVIVPFAVYGSNY